MWAVATLCILIVCAYLGSRSSLADTPQHPGTVEPLRQDEPGQRPSLAAGHRPLTLTAGDRGPFFTLADLKSYTPPPTKPHSRTTPPVWKVYPLELRTYSPLPRAYTPETIQYLAQHEIRDGDPLAPYVALTFDCETGPGSTRQILQTLAVEEVKGTFFVLGRYAYARPEITRQIAEQGHEIANHSFFHPRFTDIDLITATLEITYTEAAVARAVGEAVPMRYLRFPYGGRNWATKEHAAAWGYQSAFWNLDPKGWEPDKTPQDVVDYIRRTVHPGGIVILHCSSWNDARALPEIIRIIRDKGLEPGSLSDVLTEEDSNVPGYAQPGS